MGTRGQRIHQRLCYFDSARPEAITPANPECWLFDDFVGLNNTDLAGTPTASGAYGVVPGTGDAVTIATTAGEFGTAKILSGTADNDHAFLVCGINCAGSKWANFEARIAISSVTDIGFVMGFVDANGLDNAGAVRLSGTTFSKAAQQAAVFVFDTDATTDTIRLHGIKSTAFNAEPVNTGLVPTASAFHTYRVALVDDGASTAATFYIDGNVVGRLADVVTRTADIIPVVSVGTRTGASARNALVDYVKVWQRRS